MNRLSELLNLPYKDQKRDEVFLISVIKELFFNIYESGKEKNWSDMKIITYVFDLNLSKIMCANFLMLYERYKGMSAFV